MALPNVVGVGTGFRQRRGKPTRTLALHVFVQKKYRKEQLLSGALIPRTVLDPDHRAIATDVIEVGPVQAADTNPYRPVQGGCSIGPQGEATVGGTLGGFACDITDGTPVLLTCNHVIAHEDAPFLPTGIVQPSVFDGGFAPDYLIGTMKRFIPITVGIYSPNLPVTPVDAAIGKINTEHFDDVLQIGPAIFRLARPTIHMRVQKRGRTTELTTNGRIASVNVIISVNYGGFFSDDRTGIVANAFMVDPTGGVPFANFGDSGSLVFSSAPIPNSVVPIFPVVGMVFARSGLGAIVPQIWCNEISAIFSELSLGTICGCTARTLIQTILAVAKYPSREKLTDLPLEAKEEQLRKLLDQSIRIGPLGKMLSDFIRTDAAQLSQAISEDEEAFGLAVRTLDHWIQQRTNLDVLEATLDSETVENFMRLADRISEVKSKLKPKMALLRLAVAAAEGSRVGEILRMDLPRPPRRKKRKRNY